MRITSTFIAWLNTLTVTACASTDLPQTVLLQNVSIIDPTTGTIRSNSHMLIAGTHISVIDSTEDSISPRWGSTTVVDGAGRYALPGFWDMHVHLAMWPADEVLPTLLRNGVLGARDMGWGIEGATELRDRIASGRQIGPRLVVAGPTLDGPTDDWPLRHTVSYVEEAAPAVAVLKAIGADFVKVHAAMDRDVFFAVVEAADRAQLPVVGHLAKNVTVMDAVRAGQASIEHLIMPWCSFSGADGACDDGPTLDAVDAMVSSGARATPTLSVYQSIFHMDAQALPDLTMRADITRLPESVMNFWRLQEQINQQFAPPQGQREPVARATFGASLKMTKLLSDAGVPIMTGTDLGFRYVFPGVSVHDEMALLVQAGLSPLQALYAATVEPVMFLRLDHELGPINPGKEATFILLDANPLEDIANTRNVSGLFLRGRYYDPRNLPQ